MKNLILILILITSLNVSAAEERNGTWLGTFAKKELSENYSYWIETQVRYNIDLGNTSQVLYRTGLLQKYGTNQGLGYLYAYIQSGDNREHRFTLQHTHKYGETSGIYFSHRARLESRYLEETTESFEPAARARYLIRAEQNQVNKYNFVVWNELFLNLNHTNWNGDQTNDRNRLFIGLKKAFFNSNRFEIGYLNQFIPRETGDVSEHIATVYMFF